MSSGRDNDDLIGMTAILTIFLLLSWVDFHLVISDSTVCPTPLDKLIVIFSEFVSLKHVFLHTQII